MVLVTGGVLLSAERVSRGIEAVSPSSMGILEYSVLGALYSFTLDPGMLGNQ